MNEKVQHCHYSRAETFDHRIERGDGFDGDGWMKVGTGEVRWVAPGEKPGSAPFLMLQPKCKHCGCEAVLVDAMGKWDFAQQRWVLNSTYDTHYCPDCDGETSIQDVAKAEPESKDAPNTLTRAEVEALFGYDDTLPFSRIVAAMAAKRDAYDLRAVEVARSSLSVEGEVEIDDTALTSRREDDYGCYVMAWLWVASTEPVE